jgi:hypothetical protein
MAYQSTVSREEAKHKLERDLVYAKITNSTSEKIIVFGPKRETEGGDYKNSWYILHEGETTPVWWECDGIFVPNDRSFSRGTAGDIKGPIGVKYNKAKSVTITKEQDKYIEKGELNDGIFHPSEINWSIPNFSAEDCQKMTRALYEIQR